MKNESSRSPQGFGMGKKNVSPKAEPSKAENGKVKEPVEKMDKQDQPPGDGSRILGKNLIYTIVVSRFTVPFLDFQLT